MTADTKILKLRKKLLHKNNIFLGKCTYDTSTPPFLSRRILMTSQSVLNKTANNLNSMVMPHLHLPDLSHKYKVEDKQFDKFTAKGNTLMSRSENKELIRRQHEKDLEAKRASGATGASSSSNASNNKKRKTDDTPSASGIGMKTRSQGGANQTLDYFFV